MPDYESTGATLRTETTPREDGFRFPGEWEPHERTLMAMPPPQNWVTEGFTADEVRQQWADVANALVEYEPVTMAVRSKDVKKAKKLLSSEIELVEFPLNDGWSRDSGPMIVVDGEGNRAIAGVSFNGWGAKFEADGGSHEHDALLKARFAEYLKLPMYPIGLTMEGGGVLLDGEGTAITTEQCLLHENRNPGWTKDDVEEVFHDYFGASKTIWLPEGIVPDPVTDGHIDGMAAYVAPGVVLLNSIDDEDDPNYEILRDAKRLLKDAKDAKGRKLEIIDLPLTGDVGHMNFTIANGCVLVPTAGVKAEDDAPLAILRELFPDREVVGVTGRILAEGGGGIHCITQQLPRA